MVEILLLHRTTDPEILETAIGLASAYGCCNAGAIILLARQLTRPESTPEPLADLGHLARFGRPPGDVTHYDQLRTAAC